MKQYRSKAAQTRSLYQRSPQKVSLTGTGSGGQCVRKGMECYPPLRCRPGLVCVGFICLMARRVWIRSTTLCRSLMRKLTRETIVFAKTSLTSVDSLMFQVRKETARLLSIRPRIGVRRLAASLIGAHNVP